MKSLAAGAFLVATAGLATTAVIATAQPAPQETTVYSKQPFDEGMNSLRDLKNIDVATPPGAGDDKAACDRATQAQARFRAGLSTAREHSRALDHAKSLAASSAMRRAIETGAIPACPPDIDPEARS